MCGNLLEHTLLQKVAMWMVLFQNESQPIVENHYQGKASKEQGVYQLSLSLSLSLSHPHGDAGALIATGGVLSEVH